MNHQTKSQTIFRWLRENGISLGGLTDHDAAALRAATEIADLWLRGDHEHRTLSALAFRHCVLQMQDKMQFTAFHAIAHCGDWCHRWALWREAKLPAEVLANVPECKFGPRKEIR